MSYLLYHTASIHLVCQCQYVSSHLSNKNLLLGLVAMLEEFLDYVVAENILHQLQSIFLQGSEYAFFDFAVGCLEFLLNEARAMLIPSKLDYVTVDVSQLPSLALLLLSLEVHQDIAHRSQAVVHLLFARTPWRLWDR